MCLEEQLILAFPTMFGVLHTYLYWSCSVCVARGCFGKILYYNGPLSIDHVLCSTLETVCKINGETTILSCREWLWSFRYSLTPLEPQSRFGDKLLENWVVCPPNGTAVLKGLKNPNTSSTFVGQQPCLGEKQLGFWVARPPNGTAVLGLHLFTDSVVLLGCLRIIFLCIGDFRRKDNHNTRNRKPSGMRNSRRPRWLGRWSACLSRSISWVQVSPSVRS